MHTLTVLLDTRPLHNLNQGRGVGMYTRQLQAALEARSDVTVVPLSTSKKSIDAQLGTFDPKYTISHAPFFDLFFPTLPLRKRYKTVVTVHDVIPLEYPDQYKPGKRGWVALQHQKFSLKSVAHIITDSNASASAIQKHLGMQEKNITVTPLAAHPSLVAQPPKSIERARAQFHIQQPYLLYVGDINYNKNIPQLIKMMKHIPEELMLVCVGANFRPQPIPEWKWIETQLALSNVSSRVRFVTDLPVGEPELLAGLYSGAFAYIQPSLSEGFGLPLLEAMKCKTPVVSSRALALLETAGDHAVFADPTAEALSQGVLHILGWTNAERQRRISAALTWAEGFTWEKTAARTVEAYRTALT